MVVRAAVQAGGTFQILREDSRHFQKTSDCLEGPELTPLLTRFVTVRLTGAAQLDERIFPCRGFQDPDCSWWACSLSPEGRIPACHGVGMAGSRVG